MEATAGPDLPLLPEFFPPYWKEHRPHNHRRAHFHKYDAPGYYLITISKQTGVPAFSEIAQSPQSPSGNGVWVNLTANGQIIESCIHIFFESHPEFEYTPFVIMPDHIHIVWRVKEWLPRKLPHYVGMLKSSCTSCWNRAMNRAAGSGHTLFTPGFNDLIAFDQETVPRFVRYTLDNPFRRYIVLHNRDFFQRRMGVDINGERFHIFGNFNLLKHAKISPVVISRRHSPELKKKLAMEWEEIIRAGGVLISPFISPTEREIMRRGIEGEACIIRIIPEGLHPKYKPHGHEFNLCAEGRLLHLGEDHSNEKAYTLRREAALRFNELATLLATLPTDARYTLLTKS